jgi:hypothetical protein
MVLALGVALLAMRHAARIAFIGQVLKANVIFWEWRKKSLKSYRRC